MSIMVTGVNGLIGAHVARLLIEAGHRVVGYDASLSGELDFYPEVKRALTLVWGDTTQLSHLWETLEKHKVERVVHLASLRNEVLYRGLPGELMRVNVGSLQNLLEAARAGKIGRIVFASSASVYGQMDNPDASIPEDAPQNPVGIYATSKVMCESLLRCYRSVYGVDGVTIRASRVWGRMANLDRLEFGNPLSSFVYKVLAGTPIADPSGADFSGDFSYAPDVAFGFYRACVAENLPHAAYNIGPGKAYRLAEVADVLREIVPGADISIGPGTLPYESQSPRRGPLDVDRARAEIGYRVEFELAQAIKHFITAVQARDQGWRDP